MSSALPMMSTASPNLPARSSSSPAWSAFYRSPGASDRAPQCECHGFLGLFQCEFKARHPPQHSADAGRDARRARQIADGILVPAGGLAQASGMDREFKGLRIEVAGYAAVENCAIQLSGGGKRAAHVAVALGPSRSDL